jgi:LuxR family maltose regulon positive regulatory protein
MRSSDLLASRVNLAKSIPPDEGSCHGSHERMFERLNRASLSKYVVVHAPEGYGKSSLLSAWYQRVLCRDNVIRGAWFKVDAEDADPSVFWMNLASALSGRWPGVYEMVAAHLPIANDENLHDFFVSLSNHLVSNFRRELHYTIIMDNFGAFRDSASEKQFVEFTDTLPFNMHVIIITRYYRDTLLMRQSSFSMMSLIGPQDLALTEKETAAWLREYTGRDISDACIADVYARTEGWPLAIHAVAESLMLGSEELALAEKHLTSSLDIVNMVFSSQTKALPAHVMSFLLETAFLRSFCASLTNAVTDTQDTAEIIRYLEHHGLFTFSLDSERVWYRYHPLFASWLQSQSLRLRGYQLRTLNYRAGQWYRERNLYLSSTRHIIAASEGDFISRLAQTATTEPLPVSERFLLWLFRFAEESLETSLEFCLLAAWAYAFSGRPDDARYWMGKARGCVYEEEVSRRMDLSLRVIDAKCHTLSGDVDTGIALSDALLSEISHYDDDSLQMVLYQNLGEAYELRGDVALAMKKYARANTLARMSDFKFIASFTRYQSACLQCRKGQLRSAEELCRQALAECPPDFTVYGALYAVLGYVQLMQNKLDGVATCFKRAMNRASLDRNIDIYLEICSFRARHLIAMHEYGEAQLALAMAVRAVRTSTDVPPRGVAHIAFAYQVVLYLSLGDVDSAKEVMDEYNALNIPATSLSILEMGLAAARIDLLRKRNLDRSLASLEQLVKQADDEGLCLIQLELLLTMAGILQAQNEHGRAAACVKKAIELACPEQIIRPFIDSGEAIRLLLIDALGSKRVGIETERFVRRIVRAFDDEHARSEQSMPISIEASLRHSSEDLGLAMERWGLTSREQEVALALLRGMSRKEIAMDFCTSQNTIKTHISHIYEKIGVHSASELLRMFVAQAPFGTRRSQQP